MNDLVTWLRATLNAVEADARSFLELQPDLPDWTSLALTEVEAKRRMLDELDSWRHEWSDDAYLACSQATAEAGYGYGALPESRQGDPCTCGLDERRDAIRRLLALPYADEPGYDESWRP